MKINNELKDKLIGLLQSSIEDGVSPQDVLRTLIYITEELSIEMEED
jgi:hypothetical protein